MVKVRRWLKYWLMNLSLRKSIVLYLTVFTVLALFLSSVTAYLCSHRIEAIRDSYPVRGERYYLTNEKGEQLGEGTIISKSRVPLSKEDERRIAVLEFLIVGAAPVYSALCIFAAAMLFYTGKLKRPLQELREASEKISRNDLEFVVAYDSADELGQLCGSFEAMRSALAENFAKMWRQIEDRKQLNAVFAHELRTPLTVLKGYDEILENSPELQTRNMAVTMGKHIGRLEHYVEGMSRSRRLEDMQPEYRINLPHELLDSIRESGDMECKAYGKELKFQSQISEHGLLVDKDWILQVCNNLLSNAIRYADKVITISVMEREDGILLQVMDDGSGFSAKGLEKAVNPYYTEEKGNDGHFGLGLSICKMLCERHGGCLKVENHTIGARVTAFFGVKKTLSKVS